MFDVSFAEVLVLVTGAGMLLGKKEITQGARIIGKMVGKGVGLLQGVRVRYDEKSRGSRVYQMHSNVRMGLQDMNTIGRDLVMVGTGMPASSSTATGAGSTATAAALTHDANTALPETKQSIPSAIPNFSAAGIASFAANEQLARLILVEEKMNNGEEWSQSLTSQSNTADIVQSAITGSIMNEFYARQLANYDDGDGAAAPAGGGGAR
jgi:hypothetical protein